VFASIVLLAMCGYSTFKGMQPLAIVSIILFVGLLYRKHVLKGIEILFDVARSTKQAKFGDFEVLVGADEAVNEIAKYIEPDSAWARAILSGMGVGHIGILLTISRSVRYDQLSGIKEELRVLRGMGLLNHDKDTMAKSEKVWLTKTGEDLAQIVIQANKRIIQEQNTTGKSSLKR